MAMLAGLGVSATFGAQKLPPTPPSHVVIVIMENHAASKIIGAAEAPYINSLVGQGTFFTQSFGVSHPSEPNYLALFSGSTHQLKDDRCPLSYRGANLAQQLIAEKLTFVGYAEGLPVTGFSGCTAPGGYARKHAPWINFAALPATTSQPFSAFPTADFDSLPTVAMVVPSLRHDMHDGTVAEGDAWLKANLDPYVQWAKSHNGLLILTWDEDDDHHANQVATIFLGPMVKVGTYDRHINHYDVLRTVEALFKLPWAGQAAKATTISEIW
jgi:acid phosphatase